FWPCAAVRIWPMMTSDTRAGSPPARSRAALMATAPRSWAGMVANAPLKLPTGVRAAATMTTSSDMGISWGLSFLKDVGGRRKGGASLGIILLTELRHVNGAAIELCGPPSQRRAADSAPGRRARERSRADRTPEPFATSSHLLSKNAAQYKNAPKLTVVHKTVADPL